MDLNELIDQIKDQEPIHLKVDGLGVDKKVFIVEGDIGLTETGVAKYAKQRIDLAKRLTEGSQEQTQGLLGIESDGKILRWSRNKVLTYCVWRPTFNSDEEHQKVVDEMQKATAGWESICGIKFEYIPAKDTDENLQFGQVVFPVVRQNGGGNTIAKAFFPDDAVEDRIVFAFDGFFSGGGGFNPTGVLRHELGHVLGFRHEHIRPEAPDLFDPESTAHTVEISNYDPRSVMHYVAGGVGNPELTFTDDDKIGARHVYGGPDTDFSFAD